VSQRICALPECERPHYGKGYCRLHWRRLASHGSPTWTPPHQPDTCEVDGCESPPIARDLCPLHYTRWRKHGDPLADHSPRRRICCIDGCESVVRGHGWCSLHYLRWRAHGDPLWHQTRHAECVVDRCDSAPRSSLATLCEAHYMRLRRRGTLEAGQCSICQGPLPPESAASRQYCPDCSLARRRSRARDQEHRRRAWLFDGANEKIDSLEIFERDGWKCGLCHRKVNPKFVWPHRMSPSLDHIVPISKGGDHVRTNVHLAHLTCNLSKRDRGGGEQLMLFG
jgi:hypothetical protein